VKKIFILSTDYLSKIRLHVYKSKNEKKKIERRNNCVLILLKDTIGNFGNRPPEVPVVCACM
jgi:hypothetical protein